MKRERRILPALAAALAVLGAAACESDDPEGPTPTIAVAVAPATLSVQQGQSNTATVTLTRSNFDGAVTLAVEGAPTGVTTTVSPASLTGSTNTATVTVNVAGTVPAGNSTLTVRATGSGVTAATATLTLTVTAAPVGTYTLAVAPASATLPQGGSVQTTVSLTRTNNFAGEVTLAASGLPAGVTAAFAPAATTGNTSTLTLSAAANAAAGAATVTVTGTATGQENKTATFALTVEETSTGGNVTWTFCPAFDVPVWVAYADGDGDWVQATESPENTYTMQFDQDRGGVAYVVEEDGQAVVNVLHALRDELQTYGTALCEGEGGTKTVNGSVAGLDTSHPQAIVTMGASAAVLVAGFGNDFTLEEVADGPLDLIASRVSLDDSGEDPSVMTDRLIIRRALNPADGATLPVLDFEGTEAFEPVVGDVTVEGADGQPTYAISAYFTETGTVGLFFTGLPDMGTTMTYAGVPADEQEATDLHLLSVVALDDAENPTSTRSVQEFFLEATDRTLTLGPELDAVTIGPVAGSYPRLQAEYSPQAEYDQYFQVSFAQESRDWLVSATQGFFGAGNEVTLTIPDFTGTGGWDPDAWALEAGVQTDWFFSASGWTATGGIFTSPFVEGGVFRTATRMGSITP